MMINREFRIGSFYFIVVFDEQFIYKLKIIGSKDRVPGISNLRYLPEDISGLYLAPALEVKRGDNFVPLGKNHQDLGDLLMGSLLSYFKGDLQEFKLPLALECSDFTSQVLELMEKIPFGEVLSYGELGKKMGSQAYRAIGTVCKKNKFPIIIPCHRVVRNNGELGNYAYGQELKRSLLLHEGYVFSKY